MSAEPRMTAIYRKEQQNNIGQENKTNNNINMKSTHRGRTGVDEGCFKNILWAIQENITKMYNAKNHIYDENFKPKVMLCNCMFCCQVIDISIVYPYVFS